MYDIGISEIVINKRLEDLDGRSIVYQASAASRPCKCENPACGKELKPHKHSKYRCLIQDIKAEGKLVYIDLTVQRYKCPECQYVFPDRFTFFEKNTTLTNRLKKEFVDRCIRRETFNHIATDYSIDPKTVAAAFESYVKNNQQLLTYDYTPEVLGIDEAHIDKRYRLVLTDIKEQRLLDMKKDSTKRTVKRYLNTLDKSICKCATMDFAPRYASAVREVLPEALVVIDKFHAVQEVNNCLDKVRISLQNKYRAQGVDSKRFKKSKKLFMTNWEDLTDSGLNRLNDWFKEFDELYNAYMTKEMFRDIYLVAKSYEEASELFDSWLEFIPEYEQFSAMRKTMSTRRQDILNYWLAPYTNAYTESVNNSIKAIEKNGRGYKFDVLRERCLLALNAPSPERFRPREAVYVDTTTGEVEESLLKKRANGLYMAMASAAASDKTKSPVFHVSDYVLMTNCMTVFMEAFDSKKHYQSRQARIKAYYDMLAICLNDSTNNLVCQGFGL